MNIATLRKKARNGSLEVEDLLQAAVERLPGLSEELSNLATKHEWLAQALMTDGTRIVPFAKWATVASAYASEEFAGLRALARKTENIPFILGLLEEIHTNESVSLVLEICSCYLTDLTQFKDMAFRATQTFNLLLSFKKAVPVTTVQAKAIQEFLCALYMHAEFESSRAHVLLALRGVGDNYAIKFVESSADFSAPWSGTKESVLRAVRKRVKTNVL